MTLAVDQTSHIAAATSPSSPQTVAHVCGASANLILAMPCSAASDSTRNFTAVSYNAVSMGTAAVAIDDATWVRAEIWKLANPATGSNTLSVSNGGPTRTAIAAISFVDADSTFRSSSTATGTSANPSVSGITTVAGDIVVGVLATDNSSGATSPGGTQIAEDEDAGSDEDYSWQYVVATGTSTDLTWTSSGSGAGWVIAYVVVKQLSAGGGNYATAWIKA